MKQPVAALPGAMQAMMGLIDAVAKSGLDDKIKMLVDLRASQINGCAFCVDMRCFGFHGGVGVMWASRSQLGWPA
ncbi:MAG: carboxymuconolactone decarboxylase family protein [Microthrixaceae bacterium]|nr:carboxymuconolactone decarboxylase family protein [Microthrixaceae bacterium]